VAGAGAVRARDTAGARARRRHEDRPSDVGAPHCRVRGWPASGLTASASS
jgi:hypothetical protein